MAENLKNTLLLDGEEFNINAKYSDEAKKVTKSLTIKKSLSNRTAEESFDGSESKTIDYVPATGGKYKGPVTIDTTGSDYVAAYNSLSEFDKNKTIITSEQVNNRIYNLNGTPVCTWDPSSSTRFIEVKNSDGQIEKITTIVGTSEDFEDLKYFAKPASVGLKFSKHSSGYMVLDGIGDCADTDIVIPDFVNFEGSILPVKRVAGNAFNPNNSANTAKKDIINSIMSIVIPFGVESIGESAFRYCGSLTYVSVPESVKIIERYAFSESTLKTIKLCSGLESIADNVFYKCANLENISIPSSVSFVGHQAFWRCEKLKSIALPEGITSIGSAETGGATFSECSELQFIYIPSTVKAIEYNSFSICNKLKTIIFGGTAEQWRAVTKGNNWIPGTYGDGSTHKYCVYCSDFYLTETDMKYSYAQPNSVMTHYVVPSATTVIEDDALNDYSSLVSISIPKSVKTIEARVFTGFTKLATIVYEGSRADWNGIDIASGNDYLLKAKLITLADSNVKGTVDVTDVVKGPFIYICKDIESTGAPASNKVFLKLSSGCEIAELSKGAARLESPNGATTPGFYTYETLAAIIKGINSRLTALGSTSLALPEMFDNTGHVIIPEEIPEEILTSNKVLVDESVVPTVQQLDEAIVKIRSDLDDLTAEVIYELEQNPDNPIFAANSRIDDLEDSLSNVVQIITWEDD